MKLSLNFLFSVASMYLAAPALAVSAEIESAATEKSAEESVSVEAVPKTGIVEGVVKYRSDPKRPWQFSRYYVQTGKDGLLAEAVVALEGPGLSATAQPNSPKTNTIDQVNFQFVPETTAIRVGDVVHVTNSDDALHNVMTSDGGKPFNVSVVKGKAFAHTFESAGGLKQPIRLSCAFHGGMRAWIYVFDHPCFKVTERNGTFRFENVPAGQYTLGLVHPAGRLRSQQQVEVKANEKISVEITLSPDDVTGTKPSNN